MFALLNHVPVGRLLHVSVGLQVAAQALAGPTGTACAAAGVWWMWRTCVQQQHTWRARVQWTLTSSPLMGGVRVATPPLLHWRSGEWVCPHVGLCAEHTENLWLWGLAVPEVRPGGNRLMCNAMAMHTLVSEWPCSLTCNAALCCFALLLLLPGMCSRLVPPCMAWQTLSCWPSTRTSLRAGGAPKVYLIPSTVCAVGSSLHPAVDTPCPCTPAHAAINPCTWVVTGQHVAICSSIPGSWLS